MDDAKIISLYFSRDESAIAATDEKYGRYCRTVAYNILSDEPDSEECVSDTYLRVWQTVPPTRPTSLKAYLGRITRNLALDRYRKDRAKKRRAELELCSDELYECIPSKDSEIDSSLALADAINRYLASLPERNRVLFVQRYWYCMTTKEIARANLMRESAVKVAIMRTRNAFRGFLIREGIFL